MQNLAFYSSILWPACHGQVGGIGRIADNSIRHLGLANWKAGPHPASTCGHDS